MKVLRRRRQWSQHIGSTAVLRAGTGRGRMGEDHGENSTPIYELSTSAY
jgi:hypothetical protein